MTVAANDLFSLVHRISQNKVERQEMMNVTEVCKIAGAVAIIASAILFAALPSLLTFCLLAPIAYVGYEVATVSNNFQNIVENWFSLRTFVDGFKENRDAELWKRVTERAPVARAIARLNGLV